MTCESIIKQPYVNTLGGNQSMFESTLTGGSKRRKSKKQKAKKSRKSRKHTKRSRKH